MFQLDPRRKPERGTYELDRDHPLSRGLESLWLFDEGGGSIATDLMKTTGASGVIQWGVGIEKGGAFDGSTTGFTSNAVYTTPSAYTITAMVRTNTIAAGARNIASAGSGIAYAWQLRQDAAQWSLYQNSTTDLLAAEASGAAVGRDDIVSGSWNGANIRFHRRGILRATTTVPTLRPITSVRLGWDNFGAPQRWNGLIYMTALHHRALTPSEIAWLHSEPYAVLRPLAPRRSYLFLGDAVPPASTLFRRGLSMRSGSRSALWSPDK